MSVNWYMLRPSGPPIKMMLHDLKDVPDSLKCLSCARTFKDRKEKSRHFL